MYELLAEDSLEDLIHYGGGLLATAHRSSGQIERVHSQDGFTLIDVDLSSSELDSTPLMDGDTLYAFPVLNTMQDVVLVSGYFKRPGFYQWKKGMRIGDLIGSLDDFLPQSDLEYVLIKREQPSTKTYQALQVDLFEVMHNKDSNMNIFLQNRDEILFFSKDPENFEIDLDSDDEDNQRQQKEAQLIDPEKEMLVVKDNYIEIIPIEAFEVYEVEGFEQVEENADLTGKMALKLSQFYGNRTEMIENFIVEMII